MRGRAMKTGLRYLLVNLYQTIPKVWLWKMVVRDILSWKVYACIHSYRSNAFVHHKRFDR